MLNRGCAQCLVPKWCVQTCRKGAGRRAAEKKKKVQRVKAGSLGESKNAGNVRQATTTKGADGGKGDCFLFKIIKNNGSQSDTWTWQHVGKAQAKDWAPDRTQKPKKPTGPTTPRAALRSGLLDPSTSTSVFFQKKKEKKERQRQEGEKRQMRLGLRCPVACVPTAQTGSPTCKSHNGIPQEKKTKGLYCIPKKKPHEPIGVGLAAHVCVGASG